MTTKTIELLSVLPAAVKAQLSGKSVTSERMDVVKIPAKIRKFVKIAPRIPGSDWAIRYRQVTDGAHVGPWRKEYAAHTLKIMDTFTQPWTREVWFCGVDQSGKTMTLNNCLGWSADILNGDIFCLMPSEESAKNIIDQKMIPMFRNTPRLKRLLSSRKDDTALSRIKLNNGKVIRPAWSGSPQSMATWSAQACFGDEVDKYASQVGKETDPITMIRKRSRTFLGRSKNFFCSTPAGKFIRPGVESCQQVWENRVKCPHCSTMIKMDEDHLEIPEGSTVESISTSDIGYACNECGTIWDEIDRMLAIKKADWFAVKGDDVERPATVGFIHRAWECSDVTLREIATYKLKKDAGVVTDRIAWHNGIEADDDHHEQADRAEDYILRLIDPHQPRGVVPVDTQCLVMLVDTQRYGFRYQVWACGWGSDLRTTVIDRGFVEKFQHLVGISGKDWLDANGMKHRVISGWIDSGGGTNPNHPKHTRTQEVYVFCKKNPLFSPLKGVQKQASPWDVTRLEYMPSRRTGKKIAIPGGLLLYKLNVTLYKSELSAKLNIELGDPGGITLHADITSDYATQMCAEYQDERGYWQCPDGKANHDWDLSVYGLAAIEIMGLRENKRQEEIAPRVRHAPPPRRKRW